MKILVVGAAGRLGSALARGCSGWADVTAAARGDLDVRDRRAVTDLVARLRPDVVVNGAAWTDVDGAEDEPAEALAVNAFAVRGLAAAARSAGAALVHFSTDFVFDGAGDRPYREEDPPNPQSVYARSKLLGERFAREAPRHYVLRVESLFGWPPGEPRRTSVDRLIDAIAEGREAPVFVDRVVSPSYRDDVAAAAGRLIAAGAAPGLYHCVNSGSCTFEELAIEVGRQLGVEPRLRRLRMADAGLRAKRPLRSALANARIAAAGAPMPGWQDAVARCLARRADAPRPVR